jgi:hypothetical protein
MRGINRNNSVCLKNHFVFEGWHSACLKRMNAEPYEKKRQETVTSHRVFEETNLPSSSQRSLLLLSLFLLLSPP